MHNNIIAAGSRDRPPMLATGRYAQWRSRFLRYIDTRPNGDALRKCILKGPYTPTIVTTPAIPATEDSPAFPKQISVKTVMNMTLENRAHFESEKEAIHLILTEIGDEIYSTVDACQTAQEMWEAIERLQQDKAKEKCIESFRLLYSHLKVLSIKGGFERACVALFDQDNQTFTESLLLNLDNLEKQLDREEFQETESIGGSFSRSGKDTHAENANINSVNDQVSLVESKDVQIQEGKVDMESSGTMLDEQDTSSRFRNDADTEDASHLRIMYDEQGQWLLITSYQHPCFMIMVSVDNTSGPVPQEKKGVRFSALYLQKKRNLLARSSKKERCRFSALLSSKEGNLLVFLNLSLSILQTQFSNMYAISFADSEVSKPARGRSRCILDSVLSLLLRRGLKMKRNVRLKVKIKKPSIHLGRKRVNTYAVRNTQVLSDIEDSHGPVTLCTNPQLLKLKDFVSKTHGDTTISLTLSLRVVDIEKVALCSAQIINHNCTIEV
ncbi:hypothetical protein Tco_1041406 [Tanacetum coccineum]|uniref:Uncharacterized protein n=1 Tax=Tanacetum coccineum TaxID=301880 RepID=A0ABQ5GHI0_9ASTR